MILPDTAIVLICRSVFKRHGLWISNSYTQAIAQRLAALRRRPSWDEACTTVCAAIPGYSVPQKEAAGLEIALELENLALAQSLARRQAQRERAGRAVRYG